jgi:NTE family protein
VIISPEIGEFAYDDFVRASELVRAGEVAARAALPQIRQWYPAPAVVAPEPATVLQPEQAWPSATEPAPAKS